MRFTRKSTKDILRTGRRAYSDREAFPGRCSKRPLFSIVLDFKAVRLRTWTGRLPHCGIALEWIALREITLPGKPQHLQADLISLDAFARFVHTSDYVPK